jgi:hypothetical protein
MSVGFFTHGIEYSLPHPRIPQRIILLLCMVINKAWELLQERPPSNFLLRSADEDTITQVLVEIIENRLRKSGDIAGFNCALFGKVSREPKITNVDKVHPDKMPDIFFDLKRDQLPILSDQDGLFVECKPVDHEHPILSCYCKKGLTRFVNGDYAWAMQDALMVAYVKGHYSFRDLESVIAEGRQSTVLRTTDHFELEKHTIYRSSHNRGFEWPEGHGQACPILLAHLWLLV